MNIVDKILFDPITKGLKLFSRRGVMDFSTTPMGMSDAQATALGLKSYIHGTTYNSGIAPTVTGLAGFALVRSSFIPYQLQSGVWRLKLSLRTTFSSNSAANFTLAGVTAIAELQNILATAGPGFGTPSNYSNMNTSSGSFDINFSTTVGGAIFSGDVELASKPTWAY